MRRPLRRLLRQRFESPVEFGITEHKAVASGHADKQVATVAAGFDQAHADRWIFGESGRERTARRAGAADDVVKGLCGSSHGLQITKVSDHGISDFGSAVVAADIGGCKPLIQRAVNGSVNPRCQISISGTVFQHHRD